ncbi:juvenile hormone esterase-like isoform X2 [Episyrphus balteatus]|nr:juvenile hormone esterase-like isoform X2 [Episyrphus balteatus]
MESLIKVLIVLFCGLGYISGQMGPLVETNLGKIRGSIMRSEKGIGFYAFRGIRYAEPPVGENRFKAPVPVKKWFGELDATRDGFMCPQKAVQLDFLSEDCLILNVYSKNLSGNKSVLFYIHGGANAFGSSHSIEAAGPEYLMDSDIVLVTMNFRLGALGYLTTQTKDAPGNYGYLDQLMALQWVHDHISKFGGNPGSVTIMGISAGAFAVTLHMASPLSQGLFHRAIAMSGSATNEYAIDNLKWTQKLAHETSCPRFNAADVLDCLRKVPWQKIVEISESWMAYNLIDIKWNYEIDGHFLTKHPTHSFAEGNFTKIPIMTGITKDEFTYLIFSQENNTALLNDISLNFEKYAPEFFLHNFSEPMAAKKTEKVRTFYLGNKTIAEQNLTNFGAIFADTLINHGVHRLVDLARKYVDVFYYRFDFNGSLGAYVNWEGKSRGVCHGDDLQYILKRHKLQRQLNRYDPEWFMVERMVGIFSSFAQNGSSQTIDGVKWLSSNKTDVNTFYIDRKVKLGNEPYVERFRLWDSLYPLGKVGSSGVKNSASLMVVLVFLFNLFKFVF